MMADLQNPLFQRMFDNEDLSSITPLANQLQAVVRIVLRSALRMYPGEMGLSFVHAAIIGGIGNFGPISARDLSVYLTMHEGQMSRNIKGMVKDGLVERVTDPADSRRKLLMLSREGKKLYNDVLGMQKDREKTLLNGVSEKDQVTFFKTLKKIRANADSLLETVS